VIVLPNHYGEGYCVEPLEPCTGAQLSALAGRPAGEPASPGSPAKASGSSTWTNGT